MRLSEKRGSWANLAYEAANDLACASTHLRHDLKALMAALRHRAF